MTAAEFHLRGPVPAASPAYVERRFVTDAFAELSRGNWVVLLGPRQHGKTSGLVRLQAMLEEQGIAAMRVSLQALPPVEGYEDLLRWLARRIARQSGVELREPEAADARELDAWLAAALPDGERPHTLMLDEAAGIADAELRAVFYRQLRALHDAREDPLAPNLGRNLTCLFSGTFEPKRLATDDLTSPFNVCQRLDTEDLTVNDAFRLVDEVGAEEARPFVERAYDLVGGQPFLLQYLLDAAATGAGDEAEPPADRFAAAVQQLRHGRSEHLKALLQAVVSDPPVRAIASEVISTAEGAAYAATTDHALLLTLGFARLEGARLRPRNALYAEVAKAHPLLAPEEAAAAEAQVAPPAPGTFQFVVDPDLRRYAEEMAAGAFTALNAGHRRLALVGFGSVLEACLIDVLEQAGQQARQTAVQQANPNFNRRFEDPNDPSTWRLVNLVEVADELPALGAVSIKAADALRDWRNLVHPKIEQGRGRVEEDLAPETTAAQGVIGILLRELG